MDGVRGVTGNPLVTKLAAIMASIGTIPKLGTLDLGSRKVPYVQEFDLLEAVRDKLAAAGVMMFTSDEDVQTEMVERVNARGERRQACVVTLRTKYTLIDGESGAEVSFYGSGQGEDSGDKALYKAKTGALKYAIRETFLIATGDDPETATQTGRRESRSTAARPTVAAPPPPPRAASGQLAYKDMTPTNMTPEGRAWFFGRLRDLGLDHESAAKLLGIGSFKEDMGDQAAERILAWAEQAKLKAAAQ